jgi:hypothetical protein
MADEYVRVYVANGQTDADLIKMFLESNGIKVLSAGESIGSSYGLMNTTLGEVDIYVPQSQAQDALAAIEAMQRGDLEINSDEESEA